ncbi:hypothetical protein GCM10027290_43900 [Micromonospora sonneratiae]|uniref:Uncharacterized protein n=1 Tax=Micromonospora sonneratiae TaxID=1184706 RepID=A0ABW3Y6L0_9ACTN
MSDPYSPYSNQPDPNQPQQPQWGAPPPPGQPAAYPDPAQQAYQPPQYGTEGQPQYAAPGQPQYGTEAQPPYGAPGQAPYGSPVQPPKKSNKGLIIGLVIGVVVLLVLVACGVGIAMVVNSDDDEKDPKPSPTSSAGVDPSGAAPSPSQSGGGNNNQNNGVTARYSSDFKEVCSGGSILNAAAYSGPSGAKMYAFSNDPARPTYWSSETISSREPYYAKSADYTTVSVVACLTYVEGSEAPGTKCNLKSSDGTAVTVDYMSSRYTLTFHAAQTGEKVADGGTINAPANRCPSFMTYNKTTLKSYANPDDGALEAAFAKFIGG